MWCSDVWRRLWLLIVLLTSPGAALAQTITFRSGEHPDFSRLVLDIPIGANWEVLPIQGGYRLQMADGISYDTSRAFDRIPRTRLRALVPDNGAGVLDLLLACDCVVSAFLFRPDKLVLDISDGPLPEDITPPVSGTAAPAPAPEPSGASLPTILPLGHPLGLVDVDARVRVFHRPNMSSPLPELAAEVAAQSQTERLLHDTTLNATLRESFSAALGIGLLAPRTSDVAGPSIGARDPSLPADPLSTSLQVPSIRPGIRIETAADPVAVGLPRERLSDDGTVCLDDRLFDLASWGDERPFAEQMAELASHTVDAADTLSTDGIEMRARLFLHFGFGDEAVQLLALDGKRSVEREILVTIARILDERPQAGSTPLSGQEGCTGTVALWRILARESLGDTTDAERAAALTAHRLLPSPTRAQIGLRLSELFLDIGDPVTAARILDERGTTDIASLARAALAEAEILRQAEGPATAVEHLAALAQTEPRLTAGGLADLIELTLAEGKPIADETLLLAESIRTEMRMHPDTQRLTIAELRALVALRRFEEAIGFATAHRESFGEELAEELIGELYEGIAEIMPDSEFLELAFSPRPVDPGARAENAIARRLLGLGFMTEAEILADRPAVGDAMAERRHLRAEIALAREDYDSVADILRGMQGPRAEDLRAQAHVLLTTDGRQTGPRPPTASGAAPPRSTEAVNVLQDAAPRDIGSADEASDLPPLAAGRALLGESVGLRERALATLADVMTDDTPTTPAF